LKPFRKNVALAIDGGGIRGIIVAKALTMLEDKLGQPAYQTFRLTAGTSTGSILAAGIASDIGARALLDMYVELGDRLFKKTFWSWTWLLRGYRYSREPLIKLFGEMLENKTLGQLWDSPPSSALVLTAYDLVSNQTRFIKSWKPQYRDWSVLKAVLASSAAPTYFSVIDGRYTDGGVGAYNNPCFIAAYEVVKYLRWEESETTLISLGTGRLPPTVKIGEPDRYTALQWLPRVIETRAHDAADQQVSLVSTMFPTLDFRRFQVDLKDPIQVDDPSKVRELLDYGEEMGHKILNDEVDPIQNVTRDLAPAMHPTPMTAENYKI